MRRDSALYLRSEANSFEVAIGTGNPMHVYVIASSEFGPVKIGRGNPKKRLGALQTGNPVSLEIYHSEPVGYMAASVEREAHKVLASTRVSGVGKEWFAVTSAEARIVVQSVAHAFKLVADESKTLREIDSGAARLWHKLSEEHNDYCSDNGVDQEYNIETIDPPCATRLLAETELPSSSSYPSFLNFLMSYEDGTLMRWALERMGERVPRDNELNPYYRAVNYLEERHIGTCYNSYYQFKDPAIRRLEWSTARKLTKEELGALLLIWNRFVKTHNSTIVKGIKWPNQNVSESADNVRVKILARPEQGSGLSSIMFANDYFRAVITSSSRVDFTGHDGFGWSFAVLDQKLQELNNADLTGFVATTIADEVWEQPFVPWLRAAPESRDANLAKFLSTPDNCFPAPYRWDGPRQPYALCVVMPHIDSEGELR